MNTFQPIWILLLACCYFGVKPSQVQVRKPVYEVARVKHVIHYLLWGAGLSGEKAGELTKVNGWNVRDSVKHVNELIEPGKAQDVKMKQDIDNLKKILK